MQIGRMNKRVELQKASETQDTMGAVPLTGENWATVYNEWASIRPLSSRELILAKQAGSATTHELRMRYHSDVKSSWRVKYGDRIFEIDGRPVNVDERGREMILRCIETDSELIRGH